MPRPISTLLRPALLALLLGAAGGAWAQDAAAPALPEPPAPAASDAVAEPDTQAWLPTAPPRYTFGMRFAASDLQDVRRDTLKLRPVVGIRWGRWKVGIGDGTEWLRFSGFRKEPGISYDWFDSRRVHFGVSVRIQNIDTGRDWDPFDSGRHTARGRALWSFDLDDRTSLGLELGHDLLNRGDGSTMGLGLSRTLWADDNDLVQLSGGWTWGTGEHWQTAYRTLPGVETINSGWGSFAVGTSYRHRIDSNWAWYGTAGAARPVGHIGSVVGNDWTWSAQVGVLRFWR